MRKFTQMNGTHAQIKLAIPEKDTGTVQTLLTHLQVASIPETLTTPPSIFLNHYDSEIINFRWLTHSTTLTVEGIRKKVCPVGIRT